MPPPPPPPMETGVREHDGLYVRLGAGLGRIGASFASERSAELRGPVNGSLSHGTVVSEFAVGGTPAPGLVIGGTFNLSLAGDVTTKDLTVNGAPAADLHYDGVGMVFLGPFIDYYIDAHLGWHVQGALGLAGFNLSEGRRGGTQVRGRTETGGLGFAVGAGWEGWIGKQWSMGALLRLMYASTETNQNDAERWSFQALSFPEVLFSATYH